MCGVLAEQRRDPVASVESLQQLAIFGDAAQLHIHPTAKVNDALFNLSSGEVTVAPTAFSANVTGFWTAIPTEPPTKAETAGLTSSRAGIPPDRPDIVAPAFRA